ncbi:MAG: glycosyltransferase [Chthoniobacteraceae bacterium]
MRILHAVRTANPATGGLWEAVSQLARAHGKMGQSVEIVSLDAPDNPWAKADGLAIHALGVNESPYGSSPRYLPWLRENAPRFEAVICHGLWQYHTTATREALAGSATPYFVYPHGMLDPAIKQTYPVKHLKKWLYWLAREARALSDARAVLYTCEEERRLAQKTFWPYRCREEVVHLGIEEPPADEATQLAAFRERFPELRGQRILLFLGRLHDKKGCELLIRAFGEFLQSAPPSDAPWHLLMAGPPASEVYLQHLQSIAATTCPTGRVSFPGMLRGDLKWGAFRASEAFVLPSHQENFGIAVVEAMACGCPVLISQRVNIWREIETAGAGLCAPDTQAGTLSLLRAFATLNVEERVKMREQARTAFRTQFHIQRAAEALLKVLARK